MLVIQMLLPRFLVLEVVVFFHVVQRGRACIISAPKDASSRSQTRRPKQVCPVDLNVANLKNEPLFFGRDGQFLLPVQVEEDTRILYIPENGSSIDCPGSKLKALNEASSPLGCSGGGSKFFFSTEDGEQEEVLFEQLTCSRSIREKIVRESVPCGLQEAPFAAKLVQIGWQHGGRFYPQISVCHDTDREHTFYANHSIYGASISARETEAKRVSYFKEGRGFYKSSSASSVYKVSSQRKRLKSVLGTGKADELIQESTSFLARGHLAPDADFIYKEWQDATYYFLNVAPQWQAFNNGNWKAIEIAIRDLAATTKRTYQMFTGTLGVLSLPDDQGAQNKIYLTQTRGGEGLIPVPEFFWKILYDPEADEAIAFVGLNNPFFEGDPGSEALICPDVCVNQRWLFLHQQTVAKGYFYCCSYQDFKGAIDWIPDLGDPGLLRNRLPA